MSENTEYKRSAGARGEGHVEYQGETLPVLLTNRAIAEAEKATGKTMVQLARTSDIGIGDVVHLLRAGLEYGRRDANLRRKVYSVDETYDIMDELGFTTCAKVVVSAMADVIAYRSENAGPPVTARSETLP